MAGLDYIALLSFLLALLALAGFALEFVLIGARDRIYNAAIGLIRSRL